MSRYSIFLNTSRLAVTTSGEGIPHSGNIREEAIATVRADGTRNLVALPFLEV